MEEILVTVKDGAGTKHEVAVHPGVDGDPAEFAVASLRAWAEHGTTTLKEPLNVVSVETREQPEPEETTDTKGASD